MDLTRKKSQNVWWYVDIAHQISKAMVIWFYDMTFRVVGDRVSICYESVTSFRKCDKHTPFSIGVGYHEFMVYLFIYLLFIYLFIHVIKIGKFLQTKN